MQLQWGTATQVKDVNGSFPFFTTFIVMFSSKSAEQQTLIRNALYKYLLWYVVITCYWKYQKKVKKKEGSEKEEKQRWNQML